MNEPLPDEVQAAAVAALRKALNEGHLITGRTQQLAESIARASVVAYLHWLLNQGAWRWMPGDAGWLRRLRDSYQEGPDRG